MTENAAVSAISQLAVQKMALELASKDAEIERLTAQLKTEPYLIAHLVRGEPAFDIAIRCDDMGTESDPGPWWIIPTSGHRAYPYWYCEMNKLGYVMKPDGSVPNLVPTPPPDWPDHYSLSAAPKGQGLISNLAERLGLIQRPTIRRR